MKYSINTYWLQPGDINSKNTQWDKITWTVAEKMKTPLDQATIIKQQAQIILDQAIIIKQQEENNTDPLTWIWNRRKFEEDLKKEIAKAQQNNTEFSIIFLDADDFKQVNNISYNTWDQVLKDIALVVSESLRDGDEVYRIWWEEFVVITPVMQTNAIQIAERIKTNIANDVYIKGKLYFGITCSFWVTSYSEVPHWNHETRSESINESYDSLMAEADRHLKTAKASWKNCVVSDWYPPHLLTKEAAKEESMENKKASA